MKLFRKIFGEKHLFNGYVLDPIGILIAYLLLPMVLTGFLIYFIMLTGINKPEVPTNFQFAEIIPDSYSVKNGMIIVNSNQGPVKVNASAVKNLDVFYFHINSKQMICASYDAERSSIVDATLWSVWCDDVQHVSIQDTLHAEVKAHYLIWGLLFGIPILCWVLFIGVCYILSNAPRHPRLASFLVRKQYRTFWRNVEFEDDAF